MTYLSKPFYVKFHVVVRNFFRKPTDKEVSNIVTFYFFAISNSDWLKIWRFTTVDGLL